jgi:phosphocarrier protein
MSRTAPPTPESVTRDLEIKNRLGLHARAAAQLVQTAAKFDATITVTKDGQEVNGKSIIGLMMLAAACGTTIQVAAQGRDAEAAVAAIEALIADKFNEDS